MTLTKRWAGQALPVRPFAPAHTGQRPRVHHLYLAGTIAPMGELTTLQVFARDVIRVIDTITGHLKPGRRPGTLLSKYCPDGVYTKDDLRKHPDYAAAAAHWRAGTLPTWCSRRWPNDANAAYKQWTRWLNDLN